MAERNTDTVPAMLTPGEFVVTKDAVDNAGGPGFFYWLMNALDPGSKKPSRNEYQHGGIVHSLLSRTQNKNNNYKDVAAELESVLPREELMEMVMPMGAAQMGKGGIRAIMSSNKDDIKKMITKLSQTGKGGKEVAENVDWQTELMKYLKEATSRRFTNPVVKKQKGGSVEDYSLMDYMMPTMDKRLGKPLKKMQSGGLIGGYSVDYQGNLMSGNVTTQQDYQQGVGSGSSSTPASTGLPSTPAGSIGIGGGLTGTAQQTLGSALGTATAYTAPVGAQESLLQPSTSTSTGIESIFQEMGFKTPGEEYLSTVQAYDPTQQNRLREKIGRGMSGVEKSSFAGSGAERRDIEQQRDLLTEQYQMGAGDYRKQYREEVMAGVLDDLTQGTYDFEDLA